MTHQLTKKKRDLLSPEGLLTSEQLTTSIVIQKQQDSSLPIGNLCASAMLAPADLEQALLKHRRRMRLGELLVHLGLLTPSEVQTCLEQQKKLNPNKKFGTVLIEEGYIDEAALIRALYEQSQAGHREKSKQAKFDALVATGRLSQRDLDLALREAKAQQRPIENLLIERACVPGCGGNSILRYPSPGFFPS